MKMKIIIFSIGITWLVPALSAGLLDTVSMMNQICMGGDCSAGGIQSYATASSAHDNLNVNNMVSKSSGNSLYIRNSQTGDTADGVSTTSQAVDAIYMSLNFYNAEQIGLDHSCVLNMDSPSGNSFGFVCTQIEHSPGCPDPENPTCRTRLVGADIIYRTLISGEGSVSYSNSTICSLASTATATEKKNCHITFEVPELRIDDF